MPVHALDVFIENATKMVWIIPFYLGTPNAFHIIVLFDFD